MSSDRGSASTGFGGFLRRIFGGAAPEQPAGPPVAGDAPGVGPRLTPTGAGAVSPVNRASSEPPAPLRSPPKAAVAPEVEATPRAEAAPKVSSAPRVEADPVAEAEPPSGAPTSSVSSSSEEAAPKAAPQTAPSASSAAGPSLTSPPGAATPADPPKSPTGAADPSGSDTAHADAAPATSPLSAQPAPRSGAGVRIFAPVLERLLVQGVSPEIARALVGEAARETPAAERATPGDAYRAVARVLKRRVPVSGPLRVRRDRASIVGLVGPTGVGKSTTLAKLAAIAALKDHKTVGLITTDTFRIAATEQLKIYGRLLSLPVTVARGRDELERALERYQSRDLILLDTAGHSPRDLPKLQDLGALVGGGAREGQGEGPAVVRLLTISATTKSADVQNILAQFGAVGFDGILFTKIDESQTHGVMLNAAVWSRRPLTYFTTGQSVPQDIEVATPERLVSLLLPESEAP